MVAPVLQFGERVGEGHPGIGEDAGAADFSRDLFYRRVVFPGEQLIVSLTCLSGLPCY